MAARAMWKGRLQVGSAQIPVKLFSAAADRRVHFRLLHSPDHEPVEQRMIHPATQQPFERDEARLGYPVTGGEFVVLTEAELASLAPRESRDIEVLRFVPIGTIDAPWYVRPYHLGTDGDAAAYGAFVRALAAEKKEGIVRWVMRKKAYVGALRAEGDHLTLVTLRHSEEVIPADEIAPEAARAPNARELAMAEQLVAMYAGDFEPEAYRDEYRERVLAFVEQKARGKKPRLRKVESRRPERDLAAALAASLKQGARKVA